MRARRRSALLLMAAMLCAGAWAQAPAPAARPPGAAPGVEAPARRAAERKLDAEERDISVLVVAGNETTLSSQMAGRIKRIRVGLGDNAGAGTVLLEFDCAEQEAQLQAAEAEYRGAKETHLAKLRLQALGAAGELEVTVAAAAADKARSQIAFRESQLAYCRVAAPFSGRIAKLRVKESESVALGQALIDMVNPASLKAQLYVPAQWVRWIKPGTPFEVKTVDDRSYRARVAKVNARVEGVMQALEIEGRFDGSTQWLLPGMVGTAVFPDRPDR